MTGILTLPEPTWVVGCGNMAGAILEGWRSGGLDLSPLTVIDPVAKTIEGARYVSSIEAAGAAPKLVLLGFKPQGLSEIAPRLRPFLGAETIVLSILAGVEIATLHRHFPDTHAIVRAMPNLPVAIRRGVTGLYTDGDFPAKQQIGDLFVSLGYAMWMADEAKLAALASLAGAGPAYVARFVAALTKAGVQRGLSEETAATIALETVLGTAWLAASGKESMESLAKRVASPGGTTEAGLRILDEDHALDELIARTLDAAGRRGAEMSEEAKSASLAETERLS
jgi:pyrroline-5-carboxylate reductase